MPNAINRVDSQPTLTGSTITDSQIRELAEQFAGNWAVTDQCREAIAADGIDRLAARAFCARFIAARGGAK